ncbi:Glycosyl transferase family 2 [Acetoanaerobium noterae]|uniref:Glycosyl transferase family 2 n=1 Tax=Acetoanaerobium noterae TaxID=745369 RepID=A0A1T5B012_9FIRM|nr:glycosyltransferase [Acetoanaerobium noterae]SKB40397.1 Glycosyl transferase family 2 [Acetoanaerobium noterae]
MIDLSIVMVTYNHEKYVKDAIESILMQWTQYKYEILIGDDSSEDTTAKILGEYQELYPDKIRLIKRTENIGATKNLHDLLLKTKGRYIAYLEGDDFWSDNGKIEKQISLLECGFYFGIAHANYRVDMKGNIFGETCYFDEPTEITINDLLKTSGIFHTATLMHKNFFLNSDLDFSIIFEAHKLISDYTIACLCLNNGPILYIPDKLSSYRENLSNNGGNASAIIRRNMIGEYEEIITMYSKLESYFDKKYNFDYTKAVRALELISTYLVKKNTTLKHISGFTRKLSYKTKLFTIHLFVRKLCSYIRKKLIVF